MNAAPSERPSARHPKPPSLAHFAPGAVVRDEMPGRIGEVRGNVGPYLQLRPLGGGLEWDAEPERVRLATAGERLSAAVAVANAVSRGEKA
ncbi:hypothetical protein [Streptomyces sp. NPDC059142]|uniref:hypothetical protein n=1 Tax=Streptomyces sp. NPDC059142 TaxID=3346739 RepID=UPI0036D07CA6